MASNALSKGEHDDYEPTPTDTTTFARMLEQSSLGSDASREARLEGARILAEYSSAGTPWLAHAPAWPDITALHRQIAEMFSREGMSEQAELWLRAGLSREIDGPTATSLGAMLEQSNATKEAVTWYLRGLEKDDFTSAGRLAVLLKLGGHHELATQMVRIGRSKMLHLGTRGLVNELLSTLKQAGRRRRSKMISECTDDDLLFWVGCETLCAEARTIASECFSKAMSRGQHALASLSLYDLLISDAPEDNDVLAEVQEINDLLKRAVASEPPDVDVPISIERNCSRDDELDSYLAAAGKGDRAAIDYVLRSIRPLVVRYCRTRLGHSERTFASADDVAQEVCMAVLTSLSTYRDQGRPFLAFVYGIAAYKVIEAHRAAGRNKSEPVPGVLDSPEVGDGPEQYALQFEAAGEMNQLLNLLPDKQREILALRVVNGLSAEETAEAVGSTPGAIRVAQHRALARLRKARSEGRMAEGR